MILNLKNTEINKVIADMWQVKFLVLKDLRSSRKMNGKSRATFQLQKKECIGILPINIVTVPRAHTHPMPVSLALAIARSMQKLPTTGPRPLLPLTRAVETLCFSMLGEALPAHILLRQSFTYISGGQSCLRVVQSYVWRLVIWWYIKEGVRD